jgi:glycosyltransferase involved in cell wall biosynthesis
MGEVPENVEVCRAFGLDAKRQLSIGGRYLQSLAMPDRWATWMLGAVPAGLRLIRRFKPDVVWSTYPIATAHLVGRTLHRLSGVPWIADFRDSMTEATYPRDPRSWQAYRRLEESAVGQALRCVFTTPGAVAMYRARYPDVPTERFVQISNGYDESSFSGMPVPASNAKIASRPAVIVHSGVVYPQERNPDVFLAVLGELKQAGVVGAGDVRFVLRAAGHEDYLRGRIAAAGVADLVELRPGVAYRDALREMIEADALLVLQGANCNHQIPAKIYEYLRAGRPILALTDAAGNTAGELRSAGVEWILPLEEASALRTGLPAFLDALRKGAVNAPDAGVAASHSRQHKTVEFARLLDSVVC